MRPAIALSLVLTVATATPSTADTGPYWVPSPALTPGIWPALMAPDAGHDRLVLLGGYGSGFNAGYHAGVTQTYVPFGSTWTFDGVSWTQQHPVTSPPFRIWGSLAHDAARDQVVLFGGTGSPFPGARSDTWTWDGTNWTQQFPAVSPPGRWGAAMAYDAARQVVLLFGGWVPSAGGYANDLWAWNGTTWTQLPTPPLAPAKRMDAAMAFNAASGRVMLFGGYDGEPFGDTWFWDGTSWSSRDGQPDLPPRSAAALAADPRTGTVVLFGGHGSGTDYGDTWVDSGGRWVRAVTPVEPTGRYAAGFAYFPSQDRFVLATGHSRQYGLDINPGLGLVPDTWFFDHVEG